MPAAPGQDHQRRTGSNGEPPVDPPARTGESEPGNAAKTGRSGAPRSGSKARAKQERALRAARARQAAARKQSAVKKAAAKKASAKVAGATKATTAPKSPEPAKPAAPVTGANASQPLKPVEEAGTAEPTPAAQSATSAQSVKPAATRSAASPRPAAAAESGKTGAVTIPTTSAETVRLKMPAKPSGTEKAPPTKRAPVKRSAAAAEAPAAKKQVVKKQVARKAVNEPVRPTVAAARGGSPPAQTSRGRHAKALLIAAAVITLVSAGAVIWFGGSTTEMTTQQAPEEPEPQQTFDASVAPASPGNYIRTRLTPNGQLSSDQFIVSDEPVHDLSLQLRPMTAYREVAPEVQRLEVFADGWEVGVDGVQLAGSAPSSIPLGDPTTVIHLRYVTDGVTVPSSPSSSGRALVLANPLVARVDVPQQPAVLRLAGTEVLSLSCVRGEKLPQPCGRPDDTGWRVQMDPAEGSSGVLAQVNLPTA